MIFIQVEEEPEEPEDAAEETEQDEEEVDGDAEDSETQKVWSEVQLLTYICVALSVVLPGSKWCSFYLS